MPNPEDGVHIVISRATRDKLIALKRGEERYEEVVLRLLEQAKVEA